MNSADPWHLQKYLDEEVFRFNARRLTDADRFLLVLHATIGQRLTYKQLIGDKGNGQVPQAA